MSTEITKASQTAIAKAPAPDVAGQLMQVIAANPMAGSDNLKAMIDGMERIAKWQAEQEFTSAFARMKFPPIVKAKKGHSSKYADYADIQSIVDPILAAEGFTLTFSSGEPGPNGIPTHGLLSHVGGHSRPGTIYLPPDGVATRSGGMNMNALQAMGSATSYGMRYLAKLMLNLRFIGEDDDGAGLSQISDEQAIQIEGLIADNELGGEYFRKLLETLNVKALRDLQRVQFATALSLIRAKIKAKQEKAK